MSTIRVAARRRYTTVDRRAVNHRALSFRARGVLFWMLDKPDGQQFSADQIADATDKEGRDAIRTALRELEAAGYLIRNRHRDPVTQQWRSEHLLYEHPSLAPDPELDTETEEGQSGFPAVAPEPSHSGFPAEGNQRRVTSGGSPAPDNQAIKAEEENHENCDDPPTPLACVRQADPEPVRLTTEEVELRAARLKAKLEAANPPQQESDREHSDATR